MSRIAKTPIVIPFGVEVNINGQNILIKGKNGELTYTVHKYVHVHNTNNQLTFTLHKKDSKNWMFAGTMRALLNCMIIGVTNGFTKKLELVGVGYRVTVNNNIVNLSLGFSHIINYKLPTGITAYCPSQTEIILRGIDKQVVGQVASKLRAYRQPEPYKGKGIRYANEIIRTKEAKKK